MKNMTKLLSLMLVVAMVFSMVTIGAWAADNGKLTATVNGAAVAGKTFTVDVNMQNTAETGITMFKAKINFDDTKLELTDIADAEVLGKAVNNVSGKTLYYNNGTAKENFVFTTATKIVTLTFKVLETANVNDKLDIKIVPSDDDILNAAGDNVVYDAAETSVTVTDEYDIKAVETANVSDASLTVGKTADEVVSYLNDNVKTVNITDPAGKGTVAVKNWAAPAAYDTKAMTAQEFTADLDVDGVIVKNPDNVKAKANVTLTALTTGTFSIDGKDANVFQEADKTYTADEVANLVKDAVTAINVTSGEITDTYDAAAATYTAADTLAADTIGTSVDVTVKVSGESANKLFNVAADTVAATIAVKVVAAEITDPTQVSAKISTDSVTTSTSSLKITVTRAEARKAETGNVVVKAYKQGDDTKNVEVTGAFDANATSLELELKGAEFEALMDTLSVGNKFQIDVTYDDAAVYASDAKEPILLPVANASSGSKPSGIPSGGSSTKAQYNVTVAKTENGTVSVAAKAAKGDTVTITTTADKGYKLDKIVVTTSNGTNVPVTDKTFTMPAYNVTITATFVEGEEEPVNPTPGEDTKSEFTDLPTSHWAYEAVTALKDLGIVNGVSADSFAPDNNVTRAEFTKMVAVLFGLKATSTESKFADCGADDWFTPYVLAAAEAGYVNGVDDTHFAPDAQITRQDICTILGRVLDANEAAAEAGFTDADQIQDYAVQYVKSFVALGVVNGYEDGTFRPEVSATRAEAAKILFGITKLDNEKVKNAVAALKGEVVAPAGDNTEAVDENAADEAAADDTTADDTTVDDGSAPEK